MRQLLRRELSTLLLPLVIYIVQLFHPGLSPLHLVQRLRIPLAARGDELGDILRGDAGRSQNLKSLGFVRDGRRDCRRTLTGVGITRLPLARGSRCVRSIGLRSIPLVLKTLCIGWVLLVLTHGVGDALRGVDDLLIRLLELRALFRLGLDHGPLLLEILGERGFL